MSTGLLGKPNLSRDTKCTDLELNTNTGMVRVRTWTHLTVTSIKRLYLFPSISESNDPRFVH